MMTSHLLVQPSVSCAGWGGDRGHTRPATALGGRPALCSRDWPDHGCLQESTALEQGEAPESRTAAPSIRGHLQVSVFVSSLCRACSYCAKTTAPRAGGAQSPEQEAEMQHPQHGSPCSARAPLLKPWVGAEPPNPRKPVGISLRQLQSAVLGKA